MRDAQLLRELRPHDAERADELFPVGRRIELLGAIMGGSPAAEMGGRRGGRRRRLAGGGNARLRRPVAFSILGAAAAGTIAAAVLGTTSAVSPAPAQAVAFRAAASGDIVATVTNPFAAQAQLDAAFAEHGLEITVNLIPVSPSIVGTVLYVGESRARDQIKPLQGGHCLMGGGGCPIGIEVPRDFTGEGSVTLGRPAKSGEHYESSASIFAPGEPLHCSGLLGARVATALPALQADNLTAVQWREDITDPSRPSSHSVTDTQPPAQNYIWGAELIEPGKVTVTTASAPWPDDPGAGSAFNNGC